VVVLRALSDNRLSDVKFARGAEFPQIVVCPGCQSIDKPSWLPRGGHERLRAHRCGYERGASGSPTGHETVTDIGCACPFTGLVELGICSSSIIGRRTGNAGVGTHAQVDLKRLRLGPPSGVAELGSERDDRCLGAKSDTFCCFWHPNSDHPRRDRQPGQQSWAFGGRPDCGQAHAGTCGHDRQTAAARCAEVRSPVMTGRATPQWLVRRRVCRCGAGTPS